MFTTPSNLTVIYDPNCELCRRCRHWIQGQQQLVPIQFIEATDPSVASWARGLVPVGDELVVVSENGATWFGPDAFIMCLWALERHRNFSGRLQTQGLAHLAKGAFHALSGSRVGISAFLGSSIEHEDCSDGLCGT